MKRVLFWSPRIFAVLFALFISVFALDVFSESRGFWWAVLALQVHLIPVGILLIVLLLAWRWEWIGAVLFPALALLYLVLAAGRFPWVTYAVVSGPLLAIGALFLADWLYRRRLAHL